MVTSPLCLLNYVQERENQSYLRVPIGE